MGFLKRFFRNVFLEGVPATPEGASSFEQLTEEQKLLRLHREIMDGHYFENMEIANRATADSLVILSGGEVYKMTGIQSNESLNKRMTTRDHVRYDDLIRPIIRISEDGTLGWVIVQVQAEGYLDGQKIRQDVKNIRALATTIRQKFPLASVAARGNAFVLLSSEDRSFGVQVVGVEPDHEPAVSTLPGLLAEGRYLDDPDAAEIVIGSVMAKNLKVTVGDELTFLGSGRDGSFAAGVVVVVGVFDSGSMDMDRSMGISVLLVLASRIRFSGIV